MIRPVQLFDEENFLRTFNMPAKDILEFLESVRRMTPPETYWDIQREYVAGWEKGWKE